MLIVSFTTIPSRIKYINNTIDSILNQTTKPNYILLNIPEIFERTNQSYLIPDNLSEEIILNICKNDYGPATKLIPTIEYLKENHFPPDTKIIIVDDDIIYPDEMIENLVKFYDGINIFGCSGFNFTNFYLQSVLEHKSKVQVIEGYSGYICGLNYFKNDFYEYLNICLKNKDCKKSDDVFISNYFTKHKRDKIIINQRKYSKKYIWTNNCICTYGNDNDALHVIDNNVKKYEKTIEYLKKKDILYLKYKYRNINALVMV